MAPAVDELAPLGISSSVAEAASTARLPRSSITISRARPSVGSGTRRTWAVFWKWLPCLASYRDDLGVGRGDLSDDQWAVLCPLLPVAMLGRPSVCQRKLINGIRWRVRTGAPWRDLPAEYGPWQTVYGLFRRWQRDGVWSSVLTRLQARDLRPCCPRPR
ncbi:transposase [Streptomyces sp. NPDC096323]|uniref:transposase n=1 Tax=Streptomyces sp. NPDC096323 TaxID=3155822 RepID=UPI0033282AA7